MSTTSYPPHMESTRLEPAAVLTPEKAQRVMVLEVLQEVAVALYWRELAPLVRLSSSQYPTAADFAALMRGERDMGAASAHPPIWLCYALLSEDHQPVRTLLARSDWPLEQRIWAPTSGYVRQLRLTVRSCELALLTDRDASEQPILRSMAAAGARDLPGVRARHGQYDLEGWLGIATSELRVWGPQELDARTESARRLLAYPEQYQLFGVPTNPTHEKTRRSREVRG